LWSGIKLLLQAGSPLPEGGVRGLVRALKLRASLRNTSVGVQYAGCYHASLMTLLLQPH
jgi:hypothetical protein